jgi:hypothetical protein
LRPLGRTITHDLGTRSLRQNRSKSPCHVHAHLRRRRKLLATCAATVAGLHLVLRLFRCCVPRLRTSGWWLRPRAGAAHAASPS